MARPGGRAASVFGVRSPCAFEAAAAELSAALDAVADALLSPAEAAELAGVSERTLRSWRSKGRIRNHGTEGRPRYRRGELPRRPLRDHDHEGYDPRADALELSR
ncbi:MAG: helix-turn-helix domain-containing protein [Akkermansiaceae bacterium]|nr:helix-turn-helix domain-containing protein [Akkermansiaceae bacterium]